MSGRRVDDLVAEHRCEFGLVAQIEQQTAVDRNLAAGQCPGIGNRIVEHGEFIGQFAIADRREPLTDGVDIGLQPRIQIVEAALGLPRRLVLLFADLDFLALRDQRELLFTGYRVDRTAAERNAEQHSGDGEASRQDHAGPAHSDGYNDRCPGARFRCGQGSLYRADRCPDPGRRNRASAS